MLPMTISMRTLFPSRFLLFPHRQNHLIRNIAHTWNDPIEAAIAHGFADNLLTRAADVTLKERRRLVLMVRETPFNLAHLRNMTAVTEMGGIIFPPLPAFYHRPQSIDELVNDTVERVLDVLGVSQANPQRWQGL